MLNLHQLKIFWTVANSASLTKAAKQLGLSQPSLSQQVAKLEQTLGGRMFDRVANQLVLTDAGRYLLRRAETILAEVDEAEAGVAEFLEGRRGRIAIGALASVARCLVPNALERALQTFPDLEIELHELAPKEAIEQLYGRNIQVALLSSLSVAANRLSFSKVELTTDPYCFAVPSWLDLDAVADPDTQLGPEPRRVLNRCVQFNYGNQHNLRVEEWYRRVLPRHRLVALCRTYEAALAIVEAGLGVALVPLMSAQQGGRLLFDVRLHAVPAMSRPIVALVPSQYRRVEPFAGFLDALKASASSRRMPELLPPPPFLRRAPEPLPEVAEAELPV